VILVELGGKKNYGLAKALYQIGFILGDESPQDWLRDT